MTDTTSKTTLTAQYVAAVTRHLPVGSRSAVGDELQAVIRDMVEDQKASGTDPATAEQEALTKLGDPKMLAQKYGAPTRYLIGPALFPEYVQLLKALLAIVLPLALAVAVADQLGAPEDALGGVLVEWFLILLSVGVHLVFWTTLVFAVIERARAASGRDGPLTPWTTDQLPTYSTRQVRLPGTVTSVVFHLVLIGVVVWQFRGVAEGGVQIQVLDPDLALVWQAVIVGLLVADIVRSVLVWRVGRWTPSLAVQNVLGNVASTIVLVSLLVQGSLLRDDVPEQLGGVFDGYTDWSMPTALIAAVIIAVAAWDSIDSVVKARQAISTNGYPG